MNPSDVIDARYRLERLLGTGGMAEVWLGEDLRLGRWVAVKILRETLGDADEDIVGGIQREARVIARLQHPNIVSAFDAGEFAGRHYLVQEYVHGYSLRQLLETQGRFTEDETLRYGTQIAGAIDYAHQQGVLHCDIKPENILVNENGVAKITDFGVADTVTRTLSPEQARDVLGTIAYLAPEVIQGAPSTPQSDVYSLGLTLYEMAAGRLPFAGANAAAIAGQRLGTPAPRLRQFAMSASPQLEEVLARALSLSLADRYRTAGDFANALRRVPPPGSHVTAPIAAPPGRPPRLTGPAAAGQVRRHNTSRIVHRAGAVAPQPEKHSNVPTLIAVAATVLFALGAGTVAAIILTGGGDGDGGNTEPTPTISLTAVPTTEATPTTAPATRPPSATVAPSATSTTPPPPTATSAPPTATATTPANTPTTAPPTQPPPTVAPTAPAATATKPP
ncbi:hypothetical protein AYO38_00890 [bacterium SCGC AG-212-C10]|nr:hypothetical protein AYO38_00890 [bacterium SCGC AG-212-C10]